MQKDVIFSKNTDYPKQATAEMQVMLYIVMVLFVASIGYLLVANICVLKFKSRLTCPPAKPNQRPGVTLYKPLHGLDYGLKQNLLSFCDQEYPNFQIIFGVSSANDPAVNIIRSVITARPDVDVEVVINEQINGLNPKISNLINMDIAAKHNVLIISDSDMRVEPDYIDRILVGFNDPQTGLVTCLYKGTPAADLASNLGAMFISQWFAPSALIPITFGGMQHCFGATMAVKRDVLKKIGGLQALVNNIADDYTLGQLVQEAGLDVRLGDVVVENMIKEDSIKSLIFHELRWARTIRSVEPLGFLLTFLTDAIPLGLLLGVLLYSSDYYFTWALSPLIVAFCVRILLHFSTKATFSSKHPISFWIIPIRDLLSCFIRLLCYAGQTVSWRDTELSLNKGGKITN
jgi:ceramide glucosyltransferase